MFSPFNMPFCINLLFIYFIGRLFIPMPRATSIENGIMKMMMISKTAHTTHTDTYQYIERYLNIYHTYTDSEIECGDIKYFVYLFFGEKSSSGFNDDRVGAFQVCISRYRHKLIHNSLSRGKVVRYSALMQWNLRKCDFDCVFKTGLYSLVQSDQWTLDQHNSISISAYTQYRPMFLSSF